MKLSVLVLSCERAEAFRALAERLDNDPTDAIEPSPIHEVIVADNSHSPEAVATVTAECRARGFKLIRRPFKPFRMARMRNLAIEAATGDVFVFLDSDILPARDDFFQRIADRHRHERVLLVHGRYKENDSTSYTTDLTGRMTIVDRSRERHLRDGQRPWRIAASGNMSIRRDVLGDVRFDEQFNGAWGWEDQDLTRECWSRGVPLAFDPSIAAVHQEHPADQRGRQSNWGKFRAKWNPRTAARYAEALAALGLRSPKGKLTHFIDYPFDQQTRDCLNVLEIGCGKGLLSHYLSSTYGVAVTALDPYDGHGHRTEDEAINHELSFRCQDAVRIEKRHLAELDTPERYHVAIADISLHHIGTTTQRLQRGCNTWDELVTNLFTVYHHLRHGGVLYVIEVLPITPENVQYERISRGVQMSTKHHPREWARVLVEAGFENIETRYQLPSETAVPEIATLRRPVQIERYGYKYVIKATK